MNPTEIKNFIQKLPKAELHIHIEGSLEPDLMLKIAQRNGITTKYKSVEEIQNAYNFSNLQDFLDIYYEGAGVLKYEQDFYDLTWAYLSKAHSENIVHTEIFFDPQTHTDRGIKFSTVINGIHKAIEDAQQKLGISTKLILSFLRHLDEESAFATLQEALPYKKYICAVGLDSSELGNPPSKFKKVFELARKEGFLAVAHAGEEGPADYIWEALDLLKVNRIDHGNHSLDDGKLVERLAKDQIPMTLCPLSNLKLKVVKNLDKYPLKKMLDSNLLITINSDDPAYFGGYLNENYLTIAQSLDLQKSDLVQLAKNSIKASFLDETEKLKLIAKITLLSK